MVTSSNKRQMRLLIDFDHQKTYDRILFNDFIDKEWWIYISNISYVIMKRVPMVASFKRAIYETFN